MLVAAHAVVEEHHLGDGVEALEEPVALDVGDLERERDVGVLGAVEGQLLGREVDGRIVPARRGRPCRRGGSEAVPADHPKPLNSLSRP
jgi:hypothetical protein